MGGDRLLLGLRIIDKRELRLVLIMETWPCGRDAVSALREDPPSPACRKDLLQASPSDTPGSEGGFPPCWRGAASTEPGALRRMEEIRVYHQLGGTLTHGVSDNMFPRLSILYTIVRSTAGLPQPRPVSQGRLSTQRTGNRIGHRPSLGVDVCVPFFEIRTPFRGYPDWRG